MGSVFELIESIPSWITGKKDLLGGIVSIFTILTIVAGFFVWLSKLWQRKTSHQSTLRPEEFVAAPIPRAVEPPGEKPVDDLHMTYAEAQTLHKEWPNVIEGPEDAELPPKGKPGWPKGKSRK